MKQFYKMMGFNLGPLPEQVETAEFKIVVRPPQKQGGLREFSLIERVAMFDWTTGRMGWVNPESAKDAWNGSSAPIGRQRSLIASLRHDIAYSMLAKRWAAIKEKPREFRKIHLGKWKQDRELADKIFACDMFYYDHQPYHRVMYSYHALRLFGASAAKGE